MEPGLALKVTKERGWSPRKPAAHRLKTVRAAGLRGSIPPPPLKALRTELVSALTIERQGTNAHHHHPRRRDGYRLSRRQGQAERCRGSDDVALRRTRRVHLLPHRRRGQ